MVIEVVVTHSSGYYNKNPWPLGIRSIHKEVGLAGSRPRRPIQLGIVRIPNWQVFVFLSHEYISCMIQENTRGFQAHGEFGQFLIPPIPHIYALIMG